MASTTIATAIEIVIQNHIQGGHRRILCAEQIIQHWKLWDPQIFLSKNACNQHLATNDRQV